MQKPYWKFRYQPKKNSMLNRQQMSVLFDRDVKTIGKHINNAMREELEGQVVVAKFATTTRHGAMEGKTQTKQTEYYNLDVIISVGYRVKSKRGVAFRKWANSILTEYIIKATPSTTNVCNSLERWYASWNVPKTSLMPNRCLVWLKITTPLLPCSMITTINVWNDRREVKQHTF